MPQDDGHRAIAIWAAYAVAAKDIAPLLPQGFEPATEPDVTIEIKNMHNIGWLAGRGYSVVTVTTGVRWTGGEAFEDGRFKLVLFENMADPIITGREDLGYPKVYGDISDIAQNGDRATAGVSWDGFGFLDLAVFDLETSHVPPVAVPSWHQAYMPRIGQAGGTAYEQTILTLPGQGAHRVIRRESGQGDLRIREATWQQLPTLCNIVNGLASLKLDYCRAAGLMETEGATDLSGQVIVRHIDEKTI